MSETVIRVETLGKSYQIGHEQKERYTALRDVLTRKAKAWGRRLIGQRIPSGASGSTETFWALKDMSFEIKKGERVGIIGRNGAGKTTLLKLLGRITEPTRGRIAIRGRAASLLEVGTGFHPELTGRENIYLNGAILGMNKTEIRKKFDEIVAFADVDNFLDTPVKRYSSGMYVRLAFAVAAHLEPDILLVDEVLAVGDAVFQKKCLKKMNEVGEEGRTVLFISHNLSFVQRLCTRCFLLDRGRLQAEGDVKTVIGQYLTVQDQQGATVDLRPYRSPYNASGLLEVQSLQLLNAVGGAFAGRWDEPLRLKITFRVKRPVSNLSFGIGCETMDFVPVFTVRSTDQTPEGYAFSGSDLHEITLDVRHSLRAGYYNLILGISAGESVYYYHPNAAQLEVLSVGEKPYFERNFGIMHCDSQWTLKKI